MADMVIKFGLPPLARADARLLILGSLPGDASLAAGQYYAHPTNQFWRLVGDATGIALAPLDYSDRIDALFEQRIALWDVIESAMRPGSLDQAIAVRAVRSIGQLTQRLPDLRAIAFNGGKAMSLGKRDDAALAYTQLSLPSSSAANTISFANKLEHWRRISEYL